MDTVKNVEKAGRQVWLAGLGAVLLGKEYAVKKLDEMFEGTNSLVNQVVTKGQEIEGELKDKVSGGYSLKSNFIQDEKIAALREKLGLNQESKQDKISRLAVKVDALTEIVAAISLKAEEQKTAAAKTETATAKAVPEPATTTTTSRKPRAAAAKKPATRRASTSKATAPKTTGSNLSKTDKE